MSYLQYFGLTMGIRFLYKYITSTTDLFKVQEKLELIDKGKVSNIKFKVQFIYHMWMLMLNYISYELLKCGIPVLIKMIKEMI